MIILDALGVLACMAVIALALLLAYKALEEFWREVLCYVAGVFGVFALLALLVHGGAVIQALIEGRYP